MAAKAFGKTSGKTSEGFGKNAESDLPSSLKHIQLVDSPEEATTFSAKKALSPGCSESLGTRWNLCPIGLC